MGWTINPMHCEFSSPTNIVCILLAKNARAAGKKLHARRAIGALFDRWRTLFEAIEQIA